MKKRGSTLEMRAFPIIWNSETVRRVLLWFVIKKWGPFIPLFHTREYRHCFLIFDKKVKFKIMKEEMFRGEPSIFVMLERSAERLIYKWKENCREMYGKFGFKEQMKCLGLGKNCVFTCGPRGRMDKLPKPLPELVAFNKYCDWHGKLRQVSGQDRYLKKP